ncbi:hypothetical protein I79_013813 [Cricetulus griseus]|uniref:Uncharacterized protein n=1 Tax=Cricetulus griseus TaxID=10029 RepID=G3HSI0_CRIGR|nr:hypothetical protein I79_013813 [Cricetulus griseus]
MHKDKKNELNLKRTILRWFHSLVPVEHTANIAALQSSSYFNIVDHNSPASFYFH